MEAPVSRVCGLDTPFPLVFEPFYMPNKNKVISISQRAVEWQVVMQLYNQNILNALGHTLLSDLVSTWKAFEFPGH